MNKKEEIHLELRRNTVMDLRALEIFRCVAIEGSISRAAQKLHRVQSNISTRIKQLEQQLGRALFLRQGRRVHLTDDGEKLLVYAERLLQLSAETAEALSEGKPSGTFRIGAMESTAAARLPAVLNHYTALNPEVRVALGTGTSGAVLNRLASFTIDVGFVAEPVELSGISAEVVYEDELVLVMPDSFPEPHERESVSGKTVIAFETGCAYRRYLEEWLIETGIVPDNIMEVSSYLSILACVAAGTGYAIAPRCVIDMLPSMGRFRLHSLPERYACIKTLMVWRSDYQSVKLDRLRESLSEQKKGHY